jgi:hypothetical protein
VVVEAVLTTSIHSYSSNESAISGDSSRRVRAKIFSPKIKLKKPASRNTGVAQTKSMILKKAMKIKKKPLFDIDTSRNAHDLKNYLNNAEVSSEKPYATMGAKSPVKLGAESGTPTWGEKPSS